jgi:hypothetical protein
MLCALLVSAGLAAAQQTSTTTELKNFTVVAVDGNQVVLAGTGGAREITVPDDFRFTVDGKQMSVHDLKAGMTGTATITTKTTVTPVYVTQVKQAEVYQASGSSIILRGPDGFQSFTEGQIDKRGVKIIIDGKPVKFTDLRKGDRLTATIVTAGTPQIITERQVEAILAKAPVAPAATPASTAPLPSTSIQTSAAAPVGSASAQPAAAATAATPITAPVSDSAAPEAAAAIPAATEPESSTNWLGWGMGALALVALVAWYMRRQQRA